jgi:hypothetical protein
MITLGLLAAIAAAAAAPAAADPVRGVRPAGGRVLAIPGGVLMLPLAAERPGDSWPQQIEVRYSGGEAVEGAVVWLSAAAPPPGRHWTRDMSGLAVRPIDPSDDSGTPLGAPHLIAPIPPDARGEIRILGRSVSPVWLVAPPENGDEGPALEARIAPDLPDPESPFEYWRWVLLAERLGAAAPPPIGAPLEVMIARYHADLWRAGIARLRDADAAAAEACLERLTGSIREGGGEAPIAAWVADPGETSALLAILLDFDLHPRRFMDGVRNWMSRQSAPFFWIDSDDEAAVRLAIANPGDERALAEFTWEYNDPALNAAQVPTAAELPPRALTRVLIDRGREAPPSPPALGGAPRADDAPRLVMRIGSAMHTVHVRPAVRHVEPPGLFIGPWQPPLTLAEARAGRLAPPAPATSTTAHLRRMSGRWEILFECYRAEGSGGPAARALPAFVTDVEACALELAGVEAVTLLIGPQQAPAVAISVPETGAHRVWRGRAYDWLQVHKRSYADRWYCRIVLPDEWLGYPLEEQALLGFIRTHGGGGNAAQIETAPSPLLPGRVSPGRVAVDLRRWLTLPLEAGR